MNKTANLGEGRQGLPNSLTFFLLLISAEQNLKHPNLELAYFYLIKVVYFRVLNYLIRMLTYFPASIFGSLPKRTCKRSPAYSTHSYVWSCVAITQNHLSKLVNMKDFKQNIFL